MLGLIANIGWTGPGDWLNWRRLAVTRHRPTKGTPPSKRHAVPWVGRQKLPRQTLGGNTLPPAPWTFTLHGANDGKRPLCQPSSLAVAIRPCRAFCFSPCYGLPGFASAAIPAMGAIESREDRAHEPAVGRRPARRAAAMAMRWTAIGAAALMLAWGLAWMAVPPLVRWGIQHWGSGFAGRDVTVGRVQFRPWTLELTVYDIALSGAVPGAPAQADIRRLYIDMEMQSLVRWAPVLDALEIDAPRLRVVRGQDGRYDIDDLLQRGAARPGSGEGSGARFALYNLMLRDGVVEFTDRTTDQAHRLAGLELGIPFLSNLPADRQVTVTPRLAFSLDGSTFDTGARSTPFSEDRNTQARLQIRGLDLSPLRAYWPAGTPLRPQAGTLEAELDIGFLQGPEPRLTVGGHARLSGVLLDGPPGSAPLAFRALDVHAASVEPLRRSVHLSSVEWSGPDIAVRRDAQGRWDWAAVATGAGAGAVTGETSSSRPCTIQPRAAAPFGRNSTIALTTTPPGSASCSGRGMAPRAWASSALIGMPKSDGKVWACSAFADMPSWNCPLRLAARKRPSGVNAASPSTSVPRNSGRAWKRSRTASS
ncbi:DUF748 domain-containing protein [Paracidovorax cattleyae]|uniref:DUF748 domain-containing protein n=1 Tax=Paracidovorax cattleyae TaxID=80868 RepID=UPI003EBEF759